MCCGHRIKHLAERQDLADAISRKFLSMAIHASLSNGFLFVIRTFVPIKRNEWQSAYWRLLTEPSVAASLEEKGRSVTFSASHL